MIYLVAGNMVYSVHTVQLGDPDASKLASAVLNDMLFFDTHNHSQSLNYMYRHCFIDLKTTLIIKTLQLAPKCRLCVLINLYMLRPSAIQDCISKVPSTTNGGPKIKGPLMAHQMNGSYCTGS